MSWCSKRIKDRRSGSPTSQLATWQRGGPKKQLSTALPALDWEVTQTAVPAGDIKRIAKLEKQMSDVMSIQVWFIEPFKLCTS